MFERFQEVAAVRRLRSQTKMLEKGPLDYSSYHAQACLDRENSTSGRIQGDNEWLEGNC